MDPLLGTFLCFCFNFIGIILNFHFSEHKHFLGCTFMTRFQGWAVLVVDIRSGFTFYLLKKKRILFCPCQGHFLL